MKAGPIKSLWIILKIIGLTLQTSLLTFYLKARGQLSRDRADRIIQHWSQNALSFVKATVHVHNPHEVTLEPNFSHIIMCNHSSHYDIPITYKALPNYSIRMLAKKELFKIPFFGRMIKMADFPSIDRSSVEQAKIDLNRAKIIMQNGITLWIAPEGSRSQTGAIQPLKKGGFITAIETQAIIIPIYIAGANQILPAKTWKFHLGQEIHVHIGKPIYSHEYTLKERDVLMKAVLDQWLHYQETVQKIKHLG